MQGNHNEIEKRLWDAAEELRNRYAELCTNSYQECDVLYAKNDNLRRTRKLLLPKLISCEVDVEKIEVQIPNNGGA